MLSAIKKSNAIKAAFASRPPKQTSGAGQGGKNRCSSSIHCTCTSELLSDYVLSSIRSPNRVDFFNAVKSGAIKNSAEEDKDDDDDIPIYPNQVVMDSMDRIGECEMLSAVVSWMDGVRARDKCERRITDKDLGNGVAMLQALKAVAPECFIVNGEVSADAVAVNTQLDEGGVARRENVHRLCEALRRFPWNDGSGEDGKFLTTADEEGTSISPFPFEQEDVWDLCRFVVLAASTGSRASIEMCQMLEMRDLVGQLSDLAQCAMEDLSATVAEFGGLCTNVEDTSGEGEEDKQHEIAHQQHRDQMGDNYVLGDNAVDETDTCTTGYSSESIQEQASSHDQEETVEALKAKVGELLQQVDSLKEERDDLAYILAQEGKVAVKARAQARLLRAAIGQRKKFIILQCQYNHQREQAGTSAEHNNDGVRCGGDEAAQALASDTMDLLRSISIDNTVNQPLELDKTVFKNEQQQSKNLQGGDKKAQDNEYEMINGSSLLPSLPTQNHIQPLSEVSPKVAIIIGQVIKNGRPACSSSSASRTKIGTLTTGAGMGSGRIKKKPRKVAKWHRKPRGFVAVNEQLGGNVDRCTSHTAICVTEMAWRCQRFTLPHVLLSVALIAVITTIVIIM